MIWGRGGPFNIRGKRLKDAETQQRQSCYIVSRDWNAKWGSGRDYIDSSATQLREPIPSYTDVGQCHRGKKICTSPQPRELNRFKRKIASLTSMILSSAGCWQSTVNFLYAGKKNNSHKGEGLTDILRYSTVTSKVLQGLLLAHQAVFAPTNPP